MFDGPAEENEKDPNTPGVLVLNDPKDFRERVKRVK